MSGTEVKAWMKKYDVAPVELAVMLGSVSMGTYNTIVAGDASKQIGDRLRFLMSLPKSDIETRLRLMRTAAQIAPLSGLAAS